MVEVVNMAQRGQRSRVSKVLLAASLVGLVLSASACKKTACPRKVSGLVLKDGQATCTCSKPTGDPGAVWGSSPYTTDSDICAAATHAGAIPESGIGVVTVKKADGCPGYKGSEENGIKSQKWASFDKSFYFPKHGDDSCPTIDPSEAKCPSRFADIPSSGSVSTFACTCSPGSMGGAVWGDGTYTTDSSLCASAIHAGAITSAGGKIAVKRSPGCPAYVGVVKNNVTSLTWATFGTSFHFPSTGATAECASPVGPSLTPSGAIAKCPSTFNGVPGGRALTCNCTSGGGGSVWGDSTYTRDSSICRAAQHVGAAPGGRGEVTVLPSSRFSGSCSRGPKRVAR